MRACAGNSDVKEMVMKFLTREQTYTQLLQSVSDNERKYEVLKQDNEEKRKNLQKILLQNDNRKVGEVDPVKEERQQSYALPKHAEDDPDVVKYNQLSAELETLQSTIDHIHQRKKNIQIINDQVGGWTTRVSKKLAYHLEDHILSNKNVSLLQQFKNIATLVHEQLNQI